MSLDLGGHACIVRTVRLRLCSTKSGKRRIPERGREREGEWKVTRGRNMIKYDMPV